jgi:hypothetical protein
MSNYQLDGKRISADLAMGCIYNFVLGGVEITTTLTASAL